MNLQHLVACHRLVTGSLLACHWFATGVMGGCYFHFSCAPQPAQNFAVGRLADRQRGQISV